MTRFKAAYVSGPTAAEGGGDVPVAGRQRMRPAIALFGPDYVQPLPTEADADEPAPVTQAEAVRPTEPLLDVVVAQLAGRGPAAHQIWLPPLDQPPSLAGLLGPLTVTPRGLTTANGEAQGRLLSVLGVIDRPAKQRGHPGDESGGEAGAVVVLRVRVRVPARERAGHANSGCGDRHRDPGVGKRCQRAVCLDRADREHPRVGSRVERALAAARAVVAGRRDHDHVVGLGELDG